MAVGAKRSSAFKPNVTISAQVEWRISRLPVERGQMEQTDTVSIDLAFQMGAKNDGSKQLTVLHQNTAVLKSLDFLGHMQASPFQVYRLCGY